MTLSFWDSLEAVEQFAGHDINRAVYYPEDDRFLIERDVTVSHYEVGGGDVAEQREGEGDGRGEGGGS